MNLADTKKIGDVTGAFKLLSDPTRFKIICALIKERGGMCVYELADAVGVSHSAASHQLSKLEANSVVESYREGQSVCYSLCDTPFVENLKSVIVTFK